MHASTDRLEFAPPPQPAAVRAFALAILAHILLMLALTWGINWKRESQDVAAEAELWSSVPQPVAPPEPQVVQAPPLPAPPPPTPVPQAEPPPAPVTRAPDIALEREKKRQELAERRQEELERQKKTDARKKREELERDKKLAAREKREAEKREQVALEKAAEERQRREEQAKAAKDKVRQLADAKKLEAMRQENLKRMQGLAGASGAPSATGAAQRSAGPSANYAAKIRAAIRPHIRHPQDVPGNPPVVIEVRTSPDGTIVGQRVVKSSGNSAWDDSAIRAIIATGSLPRDTDGRVHTPIEVSVRQRD